MVMDMSEMGKEEYIGEEGGIYITQMPLRYIILQILNRLPFLSPGERYRTAMYLYNIFFPSLKKTFAELTRTEKNRISHRGKALSELKEEFDKVLKDIEKKHRAKQISDDTYHKLRDQYKQEAVETMKQLEDKKSKIK